MPYAIVLFFEESSTIPIRQVKKELTDIGISEGVDSGTHLTLAIFEDLDCDACEKDLQALARKVHVENIIFDHLGIFTQTAPVIFLAARPYGNLLEVHKRVHQIFSGYTKKSWQMYQSERWVPHITIAKNLRGAMMNRVLDICRKIPFPLSLKVQQIGLVFFEPLQQMYRFDISEF